MPSKRAMPTIKVGSRSSKFSRSSDPAIPSGARRAALPEYSRFSMSDASLMENLEYSGRAARRAPDGMAGSLDLENFDERDPTLIVGIARLDGIAPLGEIQEQGRVLRRRTQ